MHACPVNRCSTSITDTKLMCEPHWLSVDASLRRVVIQHYEALKQLAGRNGPEVDEAQRDYMDARQAVIDAAIAAEGEAKQALAQVLRKAWVFTEEQLECALGQWYNDRNPVGAGDDEKTRAVREFLHSSAADLHKLSMGVRS